MPVQCILFNCQCNGGKILQFRSNQEHFLEWRCMRGSNGSPLNGAVLGGELGQWHVWFHIFSEVYVIWFIPWKIKVLSIFPEERRKDCHIATRWNNRKIELAEVRTRGFLNHIHWKMGQQMLRLLSNQLFPFSTMHLESWHANLTAFNIDDEMLKENINSNRNLKSPPSPEPSSREYEMKCTQFNWL